MAERIISQKHLSRPVAPAPSAPIVRHLLDMVEHYAGAAQLVVARAQIAHTAATLRDPRWTVALTSRDFARLFAHCIWVLEAWASAQDRRAPLAKPEFDLLCHCVITCRSLRDVIERAIHFTAMVGPRAGTLSLTLDQDQATLGMASNRSIRNSCAYLCDLTGLSSFHRLFGWLIGEEIALSAVNMAYPPLLDPALAAHVMPHPLAHHAPCNGMRFSAALLDRPVQRSSGELEQLLTFFPFDLSAPQSKETPLSGLIGQIFGAAMERAEPLPGARDLARQFHISTATLKRRLAAEGTGLAQLKEARRSALAQRMLTDQRLPLSAIAQRLHYSDTAAFSRAFHGWTGMSPTRWRAAGQ